MCIVPPPRQMPVIRRVVDLSNTGVRRLPAAPGYHDSHGVILSLTGEPTPLLLPDPRLLQVRKVQSCTPHAVFCPYCAREAGWDGECTRRKVRAALLQYGAIGFRPIRYGQDRTEWFVLDSMTCEYGHVLTYNKTEGAFRAWYCFPEGT